MTRAPIYRPDDIIAQGQHSVTSSAAVRAFEKAAEEFLDGHSATILADLLVHRLGAWKQFEQLIDSCELPYATLTWGKTLVDEHSDRFAGVYAGAASRPEPKAAVAEADRLVLISVEFTDNTTAGFDMNLTPDNSLSLRARTPREFRAPLAKADAARDKLVLLEVMMERDDLPRLL